MKSKEKRNRVAITGGKILLLSGTLLLFGFLITGTCTSRPTQTLVSSQGKSTQRYPATSVGQNDICLQVMMDPMDAFVYTQIELSKQMTKTLPAEISWQDRKTVALETRVSAPEVGGDGQAYFFRYARYNAETNAGDYTASVSYLTRHPTDLSHQYAPASSLLHAGMSKFREIKDRCVDMALVQYRLRREHWPSAFLEKLKKLANDWLFESTYLLVELRAWEDEARPYARKPKEATLRLGTIRLIHERDGGVPMEDVLHIDIVNPAGTMKIEPGNFGIINEGNLISSLELGIHILAQIRRYKQEFGRDPFFVTYADAFSKRLYAGMGFKPLPPTMIRARTEQGPGPHMTKNPDQSVTIRDEYGIDWTPMYADENMMSDYVHARINRLTEKTKKGELKSHLHRILEQVGKVMVEPAEVFVGRGQRRNFESGQADSSEIRLFVRKNPDGDREIYLQLGYERYMRANPFFTVPAKLTEGWSRETLPGMKMEYKSGVLRYSDTYLKSGESEVEVQEIAIDPDFTTPQWARHYVRRGHQNLSELQVQF